MVLGTVGPSVSVAQFAKHSGVRLATVRVFCSDLGLRMFFVVMPSAVELRALDWLVLRSPLFEKIISNSRAYIIIEVHYDDIRKYT
jgi:hypothetical protein